MRLHFPCVRTRIIQAVGSQSVFIIVTIPPNTVPGLGSALTCTSSSAEYVFEHETALLRWMLGLSLWWLLLQDLEVKRVVACMPLLHRSRLVRDNVSVLFSFVYRYGSLARITGI